MIDIYKSGSRDFGVDGFRIDTMKHVNDEFWQAFGPEVARTPSARASASSSCSARSSTPPSLHLALHDPDRMQAVLDFPFQDAARNFASRGTRPRAVRLLRGRRLVHRRRLQRLRAADVPRQPRHGPHRALRAADNPGAGDAELVARDRLAHELMYLSRGNPVVYYGDEQGFTGDGGDQDARQDMFASRVAGLPRRRPDRHRRTTRRTTSTAAPALPGDRVLAAYARHPALRDGAQQHRFVDRARHLRLLAVRPARQREYVVASTTASRRSPLRCPRTWRRPVPARVRRGATPADNGRRPAP